MRDVFQGNCIFKGVSPDLFPSIKPTNQDFITLQGAYNSETTVYSIATFNSLIDSSISTEELQQNTLIFTVVSAASLLICSFGITGLLKIVLGSDCW
jgi:hypothetical protein